MVTLYLIVCILWGTYAVLMQETIYSEKYSLLRVWMVFFINTLLCPIFMVVALVKFDSHMSRIKE